MKTLLTLLAAVSMFSFAVPAHADHHHRGYRVPVYSQQRIVGYNAFGFPIYQTVPLRGRPFMPPGHFKQWHHDNGRHNGWYHHHH